MPLEHLIQQAMSLYINSTYFVLFCWVNLFLKSIVSSFLLASSPCILLFFSFFTTYSLACVWSNATSENFGLVLI